MLATGTLSPTWPSGGLALCTAPGDQYGAKLVSDGAGGAIIAWSDRRRGATYDVYAHHVLATGAADPTWPVNGRGLCTAPGDQFIANLVSDGAGGAIVTWHDIRGADADIYAQRVLASGAVDPAWPTNGRALCTAMNFQSATTIVSDGTGGAIVARLDARAAGSYEIQSQHVLASGAVDLAWPVNGRAICTATSDQASPTVVSDGAGGAIVAWQDYRGGGTSDIYAHHVQASGALDVLWPVNGLVLCSATNQQDYPVGVSDGAGGVIVSWSDPRSGNRDIYAQHVLASGAVNGAWPTNGRALSTAGGEQIFPAILSDGADGAIVTWHDLRGASYDIYAQRVARDGFLGSPEPEIVSVTDVPNDQGGWVKLSWNASYLQAAPYSLVSSYSVYRSVPPSLAARRREAGSRIVRMGEVDHSFARPGEFFVTVATGTEYYWEFVATISANFLQRFSFLAPTAQDSTAAGAPLTAFMVQARSAGNQHWESVPMTGYSVDDLAPAAPAPFTGQYANGGVQLLWGPNAEADLAGYRLYRGTSASFAPGPGNLVSAQSDVGYAGTPGSPYWYKLTAIDVHGNESPVATLLPTATLGVDGAVPAELAFAPPSPNPALARTTLRYALPREATVRLTIHDAAGRLVRELANGSREPGEHADAWDLRDASGRAVGAGLYFARLETSARTLVRRVAVSR